MRKAVAIVVNETTAGRHGMAGSRDCGWRDGAAWQTWRNYRVDPARVYGIVARPRLRSFARRLARWRVRWAGIAARSTSGRKERCVAGRRFDPCRRGRLAGHVRVPTDRSGEGPASIAARAFGFMFAASRVALPEWVDVFASEPPVAVLGNGPAVDEPVRAVNAAHVERCGDRALRVMVGSGKRWHHAQTACADRVRRGCG